MTSDERGGDDPGTEAVRTRYQNQLGERLRAIRTQQDLTLQDVEDKSGGEWKAVVVGSYERGDRAVSVPKLAGLARFYGVPIAELLPTLDSTDRRQVLAEGRPDDSRNADIERQADPVVIDLTRLEDEDLDPMLGPLSRFVQTIQVQRGDYNGRVLTIRGEDVLALAVVYGMQPDDFLDRLEDDQLIHQD